ncbi:uncharacterized protein BDFB_005350 [Asbolus verrucosus]|uniref:Uncharacterized protein n=1 Tax=Asbolus verrucosus TaxID=1661398 RepID=A0A482W0R0_ASBVE|nr:uncharacterized protein BDFB_005350 [Asbolus verrucosus]
MAKKAQVIQLQTEVNNDEDWEKLMQRDGLIVIDIYSEWCGPCSGMTATLKKLKLEIGGDLLQLAINGKMVNFMFGANAPKLTRLIIEELKKETDAREGRRERVLHDIEELTEEERERQEVIENQLREAREKELAKAAKELYERRIAECHNILETLNHYGIILIFHHAKTGYQEAFGDLLGEAGLTISQTEKIDITMEQLQELFFFGINPFPEESVEELLNEQSLVLLVKPIPSRDVTEPTDDLILEVVYGPSKRPPGGHDSPAQLLSHVPQTDEEGEPLEPLEMVGLWVPENELEKATALRLFFPKITEHHLIPEPEPTPPHYAVVFDALRRQDVLNLMEKYPNEIIRFGFFTSEVPENAKLIAKNLKKYERHQIKTPTPDAKLVIQLSKKKSECVLAFVQMKPQYISSNAKEGERECKIFFPDGYDEPPEKMEEEEKEKPKKKKKKTAATAVTDEGNFCNLSLLANLHLSIPALLLLFRAKVLLLKLQLLTVFQRKQGKKQHQQQRLPEEQPVPPHVVVGYDAFKYKEVMELSAQYPDAIMKYGFFSSDIPGEGELITKTVEKFEKKMTPTTYEEKIVIQLVKNSDWWSAFLELGPSYISPNTVDGEEDAKIFFPPTYDIPEEVIMAVKKKPKKKGKGKFVAVMEAHENEILQSDKQTTTEVPDESEELNLGEDADGQSTEDKTIEEDEDDEGIDETDKATSPMDNATTEDGN